MSGTIVPLIWQTYINGVEKKDVWMRIGLAQNFVTSHSTKLCHMVKNKLCQRKLRLPRRRTCSPHHAYIHQTLCIIISYISIHHVHYNAPSRSLFYFTTTCTQLLYGDTR